jgi:beta-glucuronidase
MPGMRHLRLPLLSLVALLALPPAAPAKTLYADGPDGRTLLGGEWLFRLDPGDDGIKRRFMRTTSRAGWSAVRVPHAWNVGDDSDASMEGSVGWYRRDFRLPSASSALAWVVRFESVNYRARVWLNGRPIGENRGAYLPFELRLDGLKRRGTNRLVVRVDSRRRPDDLPPALRTADDRPSGGWWNYGGIVREVYLRRVDTVDLAQVRVIPELPCASCAARVGFRVTVRNPTGRAARVQVRARFGTRSLNLGAHAIPARSSREVSRSLQIERPRLWSPLSPTLYRAVVEARRGSRTVARYRLRSGIRSVKVSGGRLLLNGRPINFRGVGYHEDQPGKGSAADNEFRAWLVRETKALGATLMRTHYPPHPYLLELADREGVLIWHEVPVYAVRTKYFKSPSFRRRAVTEVIKGIEANGNHPSVLVWSLGNEPSSRPGPVQSAYIRRAAGTAKQLDPTRPVAYALAGYPSAGCQAAQYAPLDVLGFNDYFGWYPGPSGQLFDRTKLPAYLDQVRACYPNKAIVISEFGAEANRDGPVEEKGTWAFQQEFVNFHLAVHASKPWLSGSAYWTINEFRVRPGWEGGNPRPQPPLHQKGLVTYDRRRKPAWADVRRAFAGVQQYPLPPSAERRR